MSTLDPNPTHLSTPPDAITSDEVQVSVPPSQHEPEPDKAEDRVLVWHPVSARTLRRLPNQHNLTDLDDDEFLTRPVSPRSDESDWTDFDDLEDAVARPSFGHSAPAD